jgi:hypothetical protein
VGAITFRLRARSRHNGHTDAAGSEDFTLANDTALWHSLELRSESFRSVQNFVPPKFWMMISG